MPRLLSMAEPGASMIVKTLEEQETVPAALEADDASCYPLCFKCRSPVLPDQMVVKHLSLNAQKRPLCKSCHSVTMMLQRNFDGMPDGWENLSNEDTIEFYKKMLAHKTDGPLRFQALRTEIKNLLISRQLDETRHGFNGQFHPLSYWEKQGYDVDMIKNKAEQMDHPVLGKTYRVDIFHVSHEHIAQKVEEAIRQVDKTVKRKKIPKAKAKNSAKKSKGEPAEEADPAPVVDQDLVDLVDLESADDSVEEVLPKGLTPKQLAARQNREAKKMAKEAKKLSKKITNLASKALTSMQPLKDRLQNIKKGLKIEEIQPMTLENLEKKIEFVEEVVTQSLAVMKAVGAGKSVSTNEFDQVEDDKDLNTQIKSINDVIKAVTWDKKAAKHKKANGDDGN